MSERLLRFGWMPLLFAMACGGPSEDPNTLLGRRAAQAPDPTTVDGTSAATAPTDPTAAGTTDGGANDDGGTVADAGSTTTTGTADAFTGAAAYVSKAGPSTRQSGHNFPANTPTNSPKGQACSNCHSFVLGGTVYADAAGTTPAANAEVRARDAAGNAVSAWTDQDGNFFVQKGASIAFPVDVGVRNATSTVKMSATIANGTCAASGCHGSTSQPGIHVP